jgi:hypothetical protein
MFSTKFIMSAILGSAIAVSGATIVTSTDANATAFGCQPSNGFGLSFKGVNLRVPKGYLCHLIRGNKKKISYQMAAYNISTGIEGMFRGKICNWRIDFVYYDTKGRAYSTDTGPTKNYCSLGARREVKAGKNLPNYGKSCARLVVDGKAIVTQCHKITGGFKLW